MDSESVVVNKVVSITGPGGVGLYNEEQARELLARDKRFRLTSDVKAEGKNPSQE